MKTAKDVTDIFCGISKPNLFYRDSALKVTDQQFGICGLLLAIFSSWQ